MVCLLCFRTAFLVKLAHGLVVDVAAQGAGAIPVDFFVFLGTDGVQKDVAPRTSMNIEPPDNATGFFPLCKNQCPVFDTSCGAGCISPQMRWCRCVAELLVKDLNFNFNALQGEKSLPIFTLGKYVELSKGQELFTVRDGHTTLYSLMEANGQLPYARQAGRLAVWIANDIKSEDDPNSMLAGTTLLDQPLWKSGKGAGVLFHAQTDRSSKILSHEVGHVVGFHHTAGPSMMYYYKHPECPKDIRHVETHPLVFPTCERNIMGYWYDGPYCCPGAGASFLHLRAGRSPRKGCLPNSLTDYQEAHCCGSECVHTCPKQMPTATFATKEHKDLLAKILRCWLHLRTLDEVKPASAKAGGRNVTILLHQKSVMECFDYGRKLGPCTPSARL